MTKADAASPFRYRPDPAAVKARMRREAEELLRWGRSDERHQPEYTSLEGLLRKFYLYPTFDCPLRCPYCYAEGGERHVDELDAGAFLRITREAIDAGYTSVVLVGGEPLVYYDFDRYLSGLADLDKRSAKLVLRTSFGFEVADDLMARLCSAFDEIVVSIDGDERTHDAIRGRGTWRYATGNAVRALSFGGAVSVNAVMGREQYEGVPGSFLKRFCAEHGIDKLVISSAVPLGRAAGTNVAPFEWRSDSKTPDRVAPKFSCGLGRSLYMQPDGTVYPCYALCGEEHKLGDLSKEPLADILARGDLLAIVNSGVDTDEKCRSCEVRYLCGGMCKIYARDFDCSDKKRQLLSMIQR